MIYALWAKSRFGGTIVCVTCSNDRSIVESARYAWQRENGKWWTFKVDEYEDLSQ